MSMSWRRSYVSLAIAVINIHFCQFGQFKTPEDALLAGKLIVGV